MTQPKKRVYELARELNMTNKSLLEKISSLDLGLNSHMSTLDEDVEARIRQFIQGGAEPTLVEKRVKPTVIRRRRKVVEAPTTPEEPQDKAAEVEQATAQEPAPEEVSEPVASEESTAVETGAPAEPEPEPEPDVKTAETGTPARVVETAVGTGTETAETEPAADAPATEEPAEASEDVTAELPVKPVLVDEPQPVKGEKESETKLELKAKKKR